ncbi:MAG: S8 family serine peptidase [Acidimicrobiia bacterium]|nr:S8 family serine peptidase [Acidimicrobiia bacterium]
MESRWRLFAVLLLLGALLVPVAGAGAEVPQPVEFTNPEVAQDPDLTKVSNHLLRAQRLQREGASADAIADASASSDVLAGQPLVELRFDELTAATISRVEALGFRTIGEYPQYGVMYGYVDLEVLDDLAAIEDLAIIQPEYGYELMPGDTTSQADVSINVDDARSAFGVDGSGIEVGVLSDSFITTFPGASVSGSGCDTFVTGMANQLSGDLPASVRLIDNGDGTTDEGAAMAELVHDLAPGSPLAFHTAGPGIAGFAEGILELADCGADVIVDDVIYFAEPMFQDGLIAQAAQQVVDAGIPYYSSLGNYATYGVFENYVDANPAVDDTELTPTGDDLHDFGGDGFAEVTLENGEGFRAVLQWPEPHDAPLGPGSATNMDLYLFDAPTAAGTVLEFSVNFQGCSEGTRGGDPFEIISYQNTTGSAQTVYLGVEHYCGSEALPFRIATFGFTNSITAVDFESGVFNDFQAYGHAVAEGAAGVAAIYYQEIDSGGNTDGAPGVFDVEAFSSLGGDIPIYLDETGQLIPGGPVTRFKPEITAPDGTNTTFFTSDSDGDGFPNFFGTSAAAPHAAAVAALMRQRNSQLTPAGILGILQATSLDIETPGQDTRSGAGLIDAFFALDATPLPDTTPPSWPGGASLSVGSIAADGATLSWSPATDSALQGSETAAVASYKVYLNGSVAGTTASTSLAVTGLSPGTTYAAKVEAVDDVGNETSNGPSATFTTLNPLPPGGSFTDDNGNVHEGNIEAIAFAGITRGCNPPINDKYCPDKNVTRGQMAAFLVRALGLTDDGGGNNFVDDDGSTFESDIAKLAAAGITLGCNPPTNDRFCPDNAVKRSQMASFLARALNLSPIVPPPPSQSFGDGLWIVPDEVTPGTYRNSDSSQFCRWKRLSGFGGDEDVIAEWLTQEIAIVTIAATDAGFSSEDCGTWSTDLTPRTPSPTSNFGGGAFLVGTEVAAGTWRNSNSSEGCYWERLSGFSGELSDIIANSFTFDIQTVTVMAGDVGFSSAGCGTWSKIG